MRSSFVVASLFATLALATPVHQKLHKKAIVYDIVTDVVIVTVTAGQEPATVKKVETVYINQPSTTKSKSKTRKSTTKSRRPTSTTTPVVTTTPSPIPTTTSPVPPPPPPPTTSSTTTEAPVYVPPPQEEQQLEQKQPEQQPEPTPTPAPVVETPPPSGDDVRDAALAYHNEKRALHHVGPVTWDDGLAADAAKLAGTCSGNHAIYGSYGQNIGSSGSSEDQAYAGKEGQLMTETCSGWYEEVKDFASMGLFGQSDVGNTGSTQVLHFTQVVWKGTSRIGCAVNYCGTEGNILGGFKSYFVVCNYAAAGNFGGQYASNVFAA